MELEQDNSEFNSGLAIVYMIDNLKKGLIVARIQDNYELRYKLLVEYYLKLAGIVDVKKKGFQDTLTEHEGYWQTCRDSLKLIKERRARGQHTIDIKHLEIFDFWQYKLERLQQRLGIGMPKGIDPRFAMGEV